MYAQYIDLLIKFPLFTGLDKAEILEVLSESIHPTIQKFAKNEYIFMAGDLCEHFYLLLEGSALIILTRPNGDRVIDPLIQGAVFGVISSYAPSVNTGDVQVSSDCIVMIFDKKIISPGHIKSYKHYQAIAENIIGILGKRAHELIVRINIFSFKSIRARIAYHLTTRYDVENQSMLNLPINRNEFSEFLNVARPALSRELARMKEDGIIDYYQNTISIKNLEALKASMNED